MAHYKNYFALGVTFQCLLMIFLLAITKLIFAIIAAITMILISFFFVIGAIGYMVEQQERKVKMK